MIPRSLSGSLQAWAVPFPILLLLLALLAGGLAGKNSAVLLDLFNHGFGRALGEFALLLFPAFTLAHALAQRQLRATGTLAVWLAPLVGAGMVCPDTAYATLSPLAGRRKLSLAFGAYAGFKLLFPAGALIVMTGLNISNPAALWRCALLFPLVWLVGVLWARHFESPEQDADNGFDAKVLAALLQPFLALLTLVLLGALTPAVQWSGIGLLFSPKGGLFVAALIALWPLQREQRQACFDAALRRTAGLLFMIGAASALGAMLAAVFPLKAGLFDGLAMWQMLLLLFAVAALFKLVKGSSMATFAALTAVLAPQLPSLNIDPAQAVAAICLGSLVAILPNDSYYWLVREDALADSSEARAVRILAGGAVLQALSGLLLLLSF